MARRTLRQIVAEIQRMPGLERIGPGEIMDKVNTAHKDLLNQPWPFNYAETNVLIPAPYTTGTVSIVDGTNTVTGAGGATWNVAWTGRRIQFGTPNNVDYIVSAVTGVNTLTLAQNINVGADIANSTYTLYQDTFTYPADYLFGSDVAMLNPVIRNRVVKVPRYKFELVMNSGMRSMFTNVPLVYCDHGQTAAGLFQFRIGPPCAGVAEYRLPYHSIASDFNALANIAMLPEGFDEVITLVAASKLYDLYKMPGESQAAKALADGKIRLLKRLTSVQTIDDVPDALFEIPDSSISQWGMSIARMP